MINVPSLVKALDTGLRQDKGEWDESKIHVSDLAVAIGEKCPRQLWLRLHGAEKQRQHVGMLLMWDHGQRIHERLVEIINKGLDNGWYIEWVEEPVRLPGVTGRLDTRLKRKDNRIVVDFKSVRGKAFSFLNEAKPSHVLQVQSYITGTDSNGGLVFYVDREGQNACKQFPVFRDDERVLKAVTEVKRIALAVNPPPILQPKLEISKNKGPDSIKLCQGWMCDYCQYIDVSCPGALPKRHRDLGIVGHYDNGVFKPKTKDAEVIRIVEDLLQKGA